MLDLALKLDQELRIAVELARQAADAIQRVCAGGLETSGEGSDHLRTSADLEADRILREGLAEAFPEDGVLSEESGFRKGLTERVWIVDPLDGTSALVGGSEQYAVQLGLVENGQPLLGVIFEPVTRRCYHALAGVGAFLAVGPRGTIRQLKVSKKRAYSELVLTTSHQADPALMAKLRDELGFRRVEQAHSVGFKIGRLTRREVDVYYSAHPVSYWDSCAPQVVLAASGGEMTLLDGSPLRYDMADETWSHREPIVASNGHAHEQLCSDLTALEGALEQGA